MATCSCGYYIRAATVLRPQKIVEGGQFVLVPFTQAFSGTHPVSLDRIYLS